MAEKSLRMMWAQLALVDAPAPFRAVLIDDDFLSVGFARVADAVEWLAVVAPDTKPYFVDSGHKNMLSNSLSVEFGGYPINVTAHEEKSETEPLDDQTRARLAAVVAGEQGKERADA